MADNNPKWDEIQKPNERSKEHGKKDAKHNEHEHGTGGKRSPQSAISVFPTLEEIGFIASATTYPSYYYVPNTPPVTDQDGTPMCVAYSNAYDQNQHDRPESGKFWNFDEAKFFNQIGGGPNGAYMSDGVQQRQLYGYPTVAGGDRAKHKIAKFARVSLTVTGIKAALYSRKHGVLFISPWYHSWFHPFASGKLPAADYEIGGHAYWIRGWNDTYGFRLRNSWGTDWGLSGDAFLPYANLSRIWEAYATTDL